MTKSFLIVTIGILFTGFTHGQSAQEEVDYFQSIFGMGKKAVVAEFINPENTGMESFWELYDQYEVTRKQMGQSRLELLHAYVKDYGQQNDDELDLMTKNIMKQKKSLDKLIDQYYKKIRKVSGSKAATQFYQIENYILSAIRLFILDEIPFIGEWE